jgi:hypothetical protein
MAKQTINVGQAANDGSGDPLRNAFIKANENFTELYDSIDVQDLDFQGDSGSGSIELDSQVLDIAGGTGLGTVASGQTLTINIDSSVVTLSGSQTLTNKTIDVDSNTVSNIEVDNLKSGVLDVDLTSVSASDDTIASAKAIKTYVDSQVTAQDLDFTGNSGTGGVDLDSQTLNLIGANGVVTTASGQTITIDTSSLDTRLTTAEANISSNDTDIATNASDISTNAANIASNDTDISGLDTRLTTAESNISSNDTDIATNASNIATNTSNISSNDTDIATNASNISTNTSNISTNTSNIATNATNISSNDTDITALQNDKYDKTGGTISGSVTISDDLTVNGTTTTVNTETLSVEDPLIEMANQNAANSVDTGFYAKYSLDSGVTTKYAGLFKDASDSDTFKLFKGLEVEPTTTINTGGTGYALADLDIAALSASSGSISGDLVVDTNTLYVDSANNRVSVGTTNAQQKLHVQDAGAVSIRLNDSTTNYWDLTNDSNLIFSRGGTERMRIHSGGDISFRDTSNNEAFYWDASAASLGIGTGSAPSATLHISDAVTLAASTEHLLIQNTTTGQPAALAFTAVADNGGAGNEGAIYFDAGADGTAADNIIAFNANHQTGNNYDMVIKGDGNVGIGTDSPASDISGSATVLQINDSNVASLALNHGTTGKFEVAASSLGLYFGHNGNDKMVITSSGGELLVGTTTTKGHLTISGDNDLTQANVGIQSQSASSSTHYMISFFKSDGSTVGYISHNDTATTYNTSSDYRLKENVVELTGALDRVDALKPSRFNFIADADKTVDGFIAHEVAEVVPEAISGEKDAVDEEGNAIYQGIDQSKLVPLLVGAIQELKAEIETLKSQIQ